MMNSASKPIEFSVHTIRIQPSLYSKQKINEFECPPKKREYQRIKDWDAKGKTFYYGIKNYFQGLVIYFQGLAIYFQGLVIYFQGLVIYFQGLKIVNLARKNCFILRNMEQ